MRQYSEIVIGHSLAAVAYAHLKDAVLIVNQQHTSPFIFDFFDPSFDLSCFAAHPVVYDMVTNCETRKVGFPKADLWEKLLFSLSIGGKVPIADKVQSLRIDEDEQVVTIITSGNAAVKYGYQKIRIFNDDNIQGFFPENQDKEEMFRVFDWFSVRSGNNHEYDYLCDDDELAREVYFYPSHRNGAFNVKDLVAVSYLNREQLNSVDYSDVVVRFKVINMMKAVGIRGARNGRDVKNPERYKYYAVRIEATNRDVFSTHINFYPDRDNIIFDYRSEEEVILEHLFEENDSYKVLSGLVTK